jgi:microcin C transport system substrate-binding protein
MSTHALLRFITCIGLLCIQTSIGFAQTNYKGHALSLHGDIKYDANFKHFDYVNPNAPKGGEAKMAGLGTFDNLNPFILKGVPAIGLGLIYNTLLAASLDEPGTEYGDLAESVEIPPDFSWVAFTLRANARWHDGKPVTVEDVIFTMEALKAKGHPFYRSYYANVTTVEKTGPRTVKFSFSGGENRELPLILGQLAIVPKHYWENRNFDETTAKPPLGSGPYKIESLEIGRYITYSRVADYWGEDLPVHVGQNNFDVIRYDYYRDATVAVEALKAGEYEFRAENSSKDWATAYEVPALKDGRLIKELVADKNGSGMQAFWFNTRRSKFSDPKVRQALNYTFDFAWTNTNLFFGQYTRTTSFFSNSDLSATGMPQGQELDILTPYRGRVPEEVFTSPFKLPETDGSGNLRENLRAARTLLAQAGWEVKDQKLVHNQTGEVMTIEFLLDSPNFERIAGPLVQNMKRLGIAATLRTVDRAQYQNRLDTFDFDMTVGWIRQSLSPGNEQRDFWSAKEADTKGSRNLAGIKDPVVDELIDKVISAPDRKTLVATTQALDRVLLWGHYVIPQWHMQAHRLVYWNKFGKPANLPPYQHGFPTIWWQK